MNPDVAEAIPEIVRQGILDDEKAHKLLRIARGELISIHPEIRLLFYFGVLLTTAGIGLLLKQNYQHIGPLAVAIVVGIGALASLYWAVRQAPAFSWKEVPSPSVSYDYWLLLGVLLAAADLAFIEVQFTPLGAHWPWHLLIISVLMGVISFRYDSRTVFSLSLSTFAAWRGLSVSFIETSFWHLSEEPVRWNAICCGVLFICLGRYLLRAGKKAHFEPVAVHLGWILALCGLISGGGESGAAGGVYITILILVGVGLGWDSYKQQRFALFCFGVLSVFIALIEMVDNARFESAVALFLISILAIALIVVLWKVHRRMKEPL
jgi:hypothetical protein